MLSREGLGVLPRVHGSLWGYPWEYKPRTPSLGRGDLRLRRAGEGLKARLGKYGEEPYQTKYRAGGYLRIYNVLARDYALWRTLV